MRPRALGVYLAAILGCATCSRPDAVASAGGRDAAVSSNDAAPDPSRESRIAAAVCAGRHDCKIEEVVNGGKSRQGADLYVAMARVPDDSYSSHDLSHDVWLVSAVGQDVRAVHRLKQYLAEGSSLSLAVVAPGEVSLAVKPLGEFDSSPPYGFHFALDPLEQTLSYVGDLYWDSVNFRGSRCDEGPRFACRKASLTLPNVDVGEAFEAGGWRTTSLGECSMHFGPVRALVSRKVLYVEVALGVEPPGTPLQIELDLTGGLPNEMYIWTLGMDGTLSLMTLDGKRRPLSSEHVEIVNSGSSIRRFMLTNFWNGVESMHITYGAETSGTFGAAVQDVYPTEGTCTPRAGVLEVVHAPPNPDPFATL